MGGEPFTLAVRVRPNSSERQIACPGERGRPPVAAASPSRVTQPGTAGSRCVRPFLPVPAGWPRRRPVQPGTASYSRD